MRIVLFLIGLLCWVDWLPFMLVSQIEFIQYLTFICFVFLLVKNRNIALTLNSNIKTILIAYLLLVLFSSFLNQVYPKASIFTSLCLIFIILSVKKIKKEQLYVGFLFGAFFSMLYMFLLKNSFINVDYYNFIDVLDISEYTSNELNEVVALGLTNKNNKLSYLFSLSGALILFHFKFSKILRFFIFIIIFYFQLLTNGVGGILATFFILLIYFSPKNRNARNILIFITPIIMYAIYQFLELGYILNSESVISRFEQYYFAIFSNNNVIFGNGYTSNITLINSAYVHNFFLNNFYCGGIVGFILSIFIVYEIIKKIKSTLINKNIKIYIIILLIIQCLFENNNLLFLVGSFILYWFFLVPDFYMLTKKK